MNGDGEDERSRRRPRAYPPPGSAPGVLSFNPMAQATRVHVFAFGPDHVTELDEVDFDTLGTLRADNDVVWINVDGLRDIDLVAKLGKAFNLHNLALEDAVSTRHRPKAEDYKDSLFVVLRMGALDERIETEQMSLFVGEGFVLTLQEKPGDGFEPVRQRIRDPRSRLRSNGADYLAYALIDAEVDAFFPLLEEMGEQLEDLEIDIMEHPQHEHVPEIHRLRRDLLTVRRTVWPMRELLNGLLRDEHPIIGRTTQVFLRDCYDHVIQLMDNVDTNREILGGLIDLHLSAVNNRMNEIMKVLTVIATIFIPLSFVASLYGMNFDPHVSPWNMPELDWYFGYPAALLLMASMAGGMLIYFRRKGWLGGTRHEVRRSRTSEERKDPDGA